MAQLTWRNIDAPDLTGASNMMEQARKTVSGSLTGLSEILDKEAALQATNAKAAVQRNTQAGLNQIAQQFGTAKELEEALRNGGVQKIVDGYGGMIDEQQLGAQAMQQRIGQLRQSDLAKLNYDETTKKVGDRGKFDSFLDIAATGNIDGAIQFTKENELGEYGRNAFDVIGLMKKDKFDRDKYETDLGFKKSQEARANAQEARQAALHTRQIAGLEREDADREAIQAAQVGYFQASAADEQANQKRMAEVRELEGQLQQLITKKPTTPMEMQENQEQANALKDRLTAARIPITTNMDAFQSAYLDMAKQGNRAGILGLQGIDQARGATQSLLQLQDDVDPRQKTEMTETLGRIDEKLNKTYAGRQLLSPMKDTDYMATVLKALEGNADFALNLNNQKVVDQTIARAKEYMAYIPPEALAARIAAGIRDRSIFNSGTGLAKEDFENLQSQFAEDYQTAQTLFGERSKVNQALKGRVQDTSGTTLEQVNTWEAQLQEQLKGMQQAEAAANAQQNPTLPADFEAAGQIPSSTLYDTRLEDLRKKADANKVLGRNGQIYTDEITRLSGLSESTNNTIQNGITVTDEHREKAKRVRRGVTLSADKIDERADEIAKEEWIDNNKAFFRYLSTEQIKGLEKLGINIDPKTRRLID